MTATDLAAALDAHPGTVTELLEQLAGEPVDADVLTQARHRAGRHDPGHHDPLGLGADDEILHRAVLLTGRDTGRRFVYAVSVIAAGRLPVSVRRKLETSSEPIGRVLQDHRLEARREPLGGGGGGGGGDSGAHETDPGSDAPGELASLVASSPLCRRYRLVIGTTPAMVVTEWFLPPVTEALSARPPFLTFPE